MKGQPSMSFTKVKTIILKNSRNKKMKKYPVFLVIYFLLFQVCNIFSPPSNAQPAQGPKDVWQKPWEGVPEHYRNWDYPDLQFPTRLI